MSRNAPASAQQTNSTVRPAEARPLHGGCVQALSRAYQIAPEQWLDLSSGMNPNAYPVAEVPATSWAQLPSDQDGLLLAAQAYYGQDDLLLVPGSQWAIEAIPALIRKLSGQASGRVLVPEPGYREHAWCWQQQEFSLDVYQTLPSENQLNAADICVLINPNNPSGTCIDYARLCHLHERAIAQDVLLIVDEAFIDAEHSQSMLSRIALGQLVVLRSFGKFFGLAGVRIGAVAAWPAFLNALRLELGQWPIAGPGRAIARRAWQDRPWQQRMRQLLQSDSQRLAGLLRATFNHPVSGCHLFQTVWMPDQQARTIHDALCRQGIAVRRLDSEPLAGGHAKSGLRFGLPPTDKESAVSAGVKNQSAWARLTEALLTLPLKKDCSQLQEPEHVGC
ncbi:MAG: threonine-phosphate decarboxylase [Oleiphilus sp.]|nr:MAG: threonine-phosphate decarboxylase [Oleiphilus sp.]